MLIGWEKGENYCPGRHFVSISLKLFCPVTSEEGNCFSLGQHSEYQVQNELTEQAVPASCSPLFCCSQAVTYF